jgi:hypothetical protein
MKNDFFAIRLDTRVKAALMGALLSKRFAVERASYGAVGHPA